MANKYTEALTRGLIRENPTLRLVLGTCPTLAVTTAALNGLGMGLAATFVLVCSNVAISLLRRVIPDKVRLPAFIVVIAAFTSVVQMLVKAYLPAIDSALGIYLPLITTNCAVLGVVLLNIDKGYGFAESMFNSVGAGLGFMLAMVMFAGVRERMESCDIPKFMQGLPITLVAASLVSVSFLGFTGIVETIFG